MVRVIQIPANDGSIYMYNLDTGKIQRLCDVVLRRQNAC